MNLFTEKPNSLQKSNGVLIADFIRICFPALVMIFLMIKCSSAPEIKADNNRNVDTLSQLDWARKIEFLERISILTVREPNEVAILKAALQDEHPQVIISALKIINGYRLNDYRYEIIILLDHPWSMVRWEALKAFGALPLDPSALPKIVKMTKDEEWLVREEAFRQWRNYDDEQDEKKFFFDAVFRLKDKEPAVLSEVYRTLLWYDDARAFPYLFRRSFHTENLAELREIVLAFRNYLDKPAVVRRLRYLSRKHESTLIRQTSLQILQEL
ncbi:MAG: HEAT repeat domain-containing protein [Leptospiraceae bacterium]|nr:HEAT repeat domain-containing protein [Leptospiraceae bacterium]